MEQETYELICDNCSKTFESTDEDETLCQDCWAQIVSESFEGKGE